MNETRIGGVQVRVNPDGSLWIYQPDSNRLMGSELAGELVSWLTTQLVYVTATPEWRAAVDAQSTVPGGVIATSEGPAEPAPEPVKRRPGRPRKTS